MSNTIAYTICTASHLGQAKTMADSLIKHNPGYKCIIGLVDQIADQFNRSFFYPHEIVLVEDMELPEFQTMKDQYTLLGLTCALKSFYGSYILDKYTPDNLVYIDSDIYIFNSFTYIEQSLENYSIIISPHIKSPFPFDDKRPTENVILNVGNFNGGFFALRNNGNARAFLNWWKHHMRNECYENPAEGFFDDQIWLNFVPFYFKTVLILDHDGYNVAYWNLHERAVTKARDEYLVNNTVPLVFFHYSGYSVERPDEIARHQNRFDMNQLPTVRMLFKTYHDALISNRHQEFLLIKCSYRKRSRLKSLLNSISFSLFYKNE